MEIMSDKVVEIMSDKVVEIMLDEVVETMSDKVILDSKKSHLVYLFWKISFIVIFSLLDNFC